MIDLIPLGLILSFANSAQFTPLNSEALNSEYELLNELSHEFGGAIVLERPITITKSKEPKLVICLLFNSTMKWGKEELVRYWKVVQRFNLVKNVHRVQIAQIMRTQKGEMGVSQTWVRTEDGKWRMWIAGDQ